MSSKPEFSTKTRKQVINNILQSIAMEEAALSALVNAEGKIIQMAGEFTEIIDVLAVQDSINRVLQGVVKFQMLLQFKLEDILDYEEKEVRDCQCSLTGSGVGEVVNTEDAFWGWTAELQGPEVCADCGFIEDSFLKYRLKEKGKFLTLKAIPETLEIDCPEPFYPDPSPEEPNCMVIKGAAELIFKEQGEIVVTDTGKFTYTVCDGGSGPQVDTFHMVITPDNEDFFMHDSGVMKLRGDLTVGLC